MVQHRGAAVLLISRLIPVIAFNLINYAAGLAGISWWTFLWTTGLGILPLTALFTIMGDRLLTLPPWMWGCGCRSAQLSCSAGSFLNAVTWRRVSDSNQPHWNRAGARKAVQHNHGALHGAVPCSISSL
jgi:uncharacterized membrane protein YdjX (TVP38/TMEM64 family)